MQPFIILVILAVAASLMGNILGPKENWGFSQANIAQIDLFDGNNSSQEETTSQNTPTKSNQNTDSNKKTDQSPIPISEGNIFIDTAIVSGPITNEIIEETNRLTFGFDAEVLPATKDKIIFESKVLGLDENWVESKDSKRTIVFPLGNNKFTILARAKIKDVFDPTPASRTFQLKISPAFEKVKISKVTAPTVTKPSLILLETNIKEGEKVKISGWEFKAKYGTFFIPKGVEIYNPNSGSVPLSDIYLQKDDKVYLSSAPNPLGQKNLNFRSNICLGYLLTDKISGIPISKSCPKPNTSSLPSSFDTCCQNYIKSLGSCESLSTKKMKDYGVLPEDSTCREYINTNFSYSGCFTKNSQNPKFLEKKWQIYLDRQDREILDTKSDTLYLRDESGLFVSKINYSQLNCWDRCE